MSEPNEQDKTIVGVGSYEEIDYSVYKRPDGSKYIEIDDPAIANAVEEAGADMSILENIGDEPHVDVMERFIQSIPFEGDAETPTIA